MKWRKLPESVFHIYGGKSAAQSYRNENIRKTLAAKHGHKLKEIAVVVGNSSIGLESNLKKRKLAQDELNIPNRVVVIDTLEKEKSEGDNISKGEHQNSVTEEGKTNGNVEETLQSQEVEVDLFQDHSVPDLSGFDCTPFWNRHHSSFRRKDSNHTKKIGVSWSLLT